MLNIGQVVYDLTNERVLIFGGIEMLQNQKSGKCHSNSNFITEDLEELFYGEDESAPFEYINFASVDKAVPLGDFVKVAGLGGHYFGCLKFKEILKNAELVEAIKNTIKEAKTWPIPKGKEKAKR